MLYFVNKFYFYFYNWLCFTLFFSFFIGQMSDGQLEQRRKVEEEEIKERHSVTISDVERNKFISNSRISLDDSRRSFFENRTSLDFDRKSKPKITKNYSLNITQPSSRILQMFKPKRKIIHVRNISRQSFDGKRNEPQTPESDFEEKQSFENIETDGVTTNGTEDREDREDEEDLPELEEPEELSNIGLRRRDESFRKLSKNYRERFRLDPRFYFFFHLIWIIFVGLFGGTLVFMIETSNSKISFIDSIFTSFSAVTVTGLFVVNFPSLLFSSKFICLCCISK